MELSILVRVQVPEPTSPESHIVYNETEIPCIYNRSVSLAIRVPSGGSILSFPQVTDYSKIGASSDLRCGPEIPDLGRAY